MTDTNLKSNNDMPGCLQETMLQPQALNVAGLPQMVEQNRGRVECNALNANSYDYIIETDNIYFSYFENKDVLRGISLKIQKGKKTAIIGPNGAGKSTLFLHFNGILKPKKGKMIFKNQEVKYNHKSLSELRKKIGIVFQNPDTQLFSASVIQEISFGPINMGFSKEKVEQQVNFALETTGITSLKDQPTHCLSCGQKKSVTIASIVSMEPEVIIFDEPTNYLDPQNKIQLMDFLSELNNKGVTIILSTHNVDIAYSWADNIVVMNDGMILKQGLSEEIFTDTELMNKSNLSIPIILELYYELKKNGRINPDSPVPKNKTELFKLINK